MKIKETFLKGVCLIDPNKLEDGRGYFFRVFCKESFLKAGMPSLDFVQINHSFNLRKGTFRGLHFQYPPYAEDKLIRCCAGKVLDIVVDLRKGSPTFLNHLGVELDDSSHQMIFIPKGFAHGFLTLRDNTSLIYHHSVEYKPDHEGALSIYDPRLNIELPDEINSISKRDKNHPFLEEAFNGIKI